MWIKYFANYLALMKRQKRLIRNRLGPNSYPKQSVINKLLSVQYVFLYIVCILCICVRVGQREAYKSFGIFWKVLNEISVLDLIFFLNMYPV